MTFLKFLSFQKFDGQFFINNWHVDSLDIFSYPGLVSTQAENVFLIRWQTN